ncbi:dienelactone hydrolase family protein [Bradyrhizobium prioriisuperbiae]|uniref:dienelactone hydrolase family protein n=1 Tax=Bradyrhizobium prioriisuperbiae TaxID=2854389 RepID=UPI0028E1C5FF|nr:dienelactone hydrolase family protein [Bradyrhizobium prioritasuperba]
MKALRHRAAIWCVALFAGVAIPAVRMAGAAGPSLGPLPERVTFASADGRTTLVGYVFKPEGPHPARTPAVVMMHGRAGAYSSAAKGRYDASTLSRRHQAWGHHWAEQGYLAVLVDGFGPRGYPQGFPRFSYDTRPDTLNEVTVRPLDAYGALAWLRTRDDVVADRIALQGWSNGGSAVLATMSASAPGITSPTPATGFRAALAFYPACGLKGQFDNGLVSYAPVRVFHGSADEEVSPRRCAELVDRSRDRGGDIQFQLYRGATHNFDDPSPAHQDDDANAAATADVIRRVTAFFAKALKP